jgi:alpha-L-rhamnosidase
MRPGVPSNGLQAVAASYDSVRGTIGSAWRRQGGAFEWDIVVPPNASARVFVPAGRPEAVFEGGAGAEVPAGRAEGVRLVGTEEGRVVYEVGSGRYRLRVRP